MLTLINFLGVLCPLIGLFATIPMSMMTTVFVCRKLAKTDIEVSGQDKLNNLPLVLVEKWAFHVTQPSKESDYVVSSTSEPVVRFYL